MVTSGGPWTEDKQPTVTVTVPRNVVLTCCQLNKTCRMVGFDKACRIWTLKAVGQ